MLILLPNLYGEEEDPKRFFSQEVEEAVHLLEVLACESEKSAFLFLSIFFPKEKARSFPILIYNEHTKDLTPILEALQLGKKIGLISDAGLPSLADPGNKLVFLARKKGIEVRVVGSPSAIIKALLLSGFSAQSFSFHGYLPRKEEELKKKLRSLEKNSKEQTQLFIEAPYRTPKLLKQILQSLQNETLLCIAQNLSTKDEIVRTLSVKDWKKIPPLAKGPAIFLLSSQ